MTGAEELILKELAKVQDQIGDLREDVAALNTLPERIKVLEGFRSKLLMAVGGSGILGGGLGAVARSFFGT